MSYRFAIIGCGRIAERHAQQIARHGSLVAVCDTVPEKARKLAEKYGAKAYFSTDELFQHEKPDLVSVCSPNGLHPRHSIQALQHGATVLCEKPMAINQHDAAKMIEAANKAGKKLYVVKQNRYNPPVVAVKKLLDEGKFGRIHSFQLNCFWNRPNSYYNDEWRGTLNLDGGTLFTQFSHFIDLLYWFMGDLKKVTGTRANFQHKAVIEFEDTGSALLEMNNGAIGSLNYTINSFNGNMEGSLSLFGEKGTIKIGGHYLNKLEFFAVENEPNPVLPEGNGANQYGFYEGSMSNHDKVYEDLIRAINSPDHSMVEAAEALKTVEIIEKIYSASPLMH